MKVVSTGSIFRLYNDDVKTHNNLPAQTYMVRMSQMTGFYLEAVNELEVKEDIIYGVHTRKVGKVLNTFETTNRHLGIILSGDKGIGKTLFSKMLGKEAIKKGYPLIIVDDYYPGIANFLEGIEQEVVVMFDEFDKTFASMKNGDVNPQVELLTLFDGYSTGKKMFVITCNELRGLNDYLVNRPGRFHYHFRFEYPTAEEIKTYLTDKLNPEYVSEIQKVIAFSRKINLNYDCLRSIAFELNLGEKFEDAIKDLNIVNTESPVYNVTLVDAMGTVVERHTGIRLDMFSPEEADVCFYESGWDFYYSFIPTKASCDAFTGNMSISKENFKFEKESGCDDEALIKKYESVEMLLITRQQKASLHYAV